MNTNKIIVEGIISRINYKNINKNLIHFEVARNREYVSKDGFVEKETSFFSAVIKTDELEKYKELFKVGSRVVVTGIPNSYFDNEGRKCFMIKVLKIESPEDYIEEEKFVGPKISFDTDGVMLWNGKRCEATPMDPEEEKELRVMLDKYD